MIDLSIAFFSSLIATLLIIRFNHLHSHISADADLFGPQKYHKIIVPRIGGISIALGLSIGIWIGAKNSPDAWTYTALLISAIPTFAIGIIEDTTKKIGVRSRLLCTVISSALMIHLLQAKIIWLDIPILDPLLAIPVIATLFTIFAVTGLANAYNIIDGFHGLSSMTGITVLLAIAYVAYTIGDQTIIYLSLVMAVSIFGFFILNYPHGLIFLGDGGAYLIGFWIATLSILITYRYQQISPWFALLVNGYPIIETLFTIYRRKIHQGKNPGQPDGIHIHTLLYRRILMKNHLDSCWISPNARTSPYLWGFSSLCIISAILGRHSTPILIGLSALLFIFYLWLYSRIVKFRTPKWLFFK